jgi:hypothetical protein
VFHIRRRLCRPLRVQKEETKGFSSHQDDPFVSRVGGLPVRKSWAEGASF